MKLFPSILTSAIAGDPTIGTPISFSLDEIQYLARPWNASHVHQNLIISEWTEPTLMTCLKVANGQVTNDTLLGWREAILNKDDVFHPTFLQHIVFSGIGPSDVHLKNDVAGLLEEWGTQYVDYDVDLGMPSGPYLVYQGIVHSVWRVYEDRQLAFTQALWPSPHSDRTFTQSAAAGNGYRSHGIVVPSRLSAKIFDASISSYGNSVNPSRCLQGLRFAIKDNYHVGGAKTAVGNRAFFETYPVQQSSADVVSRLLDAGADLVGKVHLSMFALMEHPTQSVDYQAPFNPRGDGYLIPGGSSSGSAAAVASYDWLDFSICSDTTGSARIPALQQGLFGFRSSTGSISGNGLVKAWPGFDTPGIITRDLAMIPRILRVLSTLPETEGQTHSASSSTILYPTDLIPSDSDEQVAAMEEFLQSLSDSTGSAYKKISIREDWSKASPVNEKDLNQYLFNGTRYGFYYSAYHSFDSFREDYRQVHGFDPFVTELVRWYWQLGSEVSQTEHEDIMGRFSVFKTWFVKQYMTEGKTMVALHIDQIQPRYRDQYPGNSSSVIPGLRATYLSAILNAPELAVPISEFVYQSRITNQEEKLPVVVSLMGAPGTDFQLLDWILQSLKQSGRPTTKAPIVS